MKHSRRTLFVCEHLLDGPHVYSFFKFKMDKRLVKGAVCNFCKAYVDNGKEPPKEPYQVCASCFYQAITLQLN